MQYLITALKDVTVCAYVRSKTPVDLGGVAAMKPTERLEWVSQRAGKVREGLGLVLGVHPSYVPNEQPVAVRQLGVTLVMPGGGSNGDLPKGFFGLYRIEAQPDR